ncbi:hypothetical protein Droror1_Dr00025227 [Drosera rotundifolia]
MGFQLHGCCAIFFLFLHAPSTTLITVVAAPYDDRNHTRQPTWHNFSKFLDISKGSHVTGMSELKKYFHHFGYLSCPQTSFKFTDVFDETLESAVVLYQKILGLPVTGILDTETLNQIMLPRCGVRDGIRESHDGVETKFQATEMKRFAYFDGEPRWEKMTPITLTYAFSEDHMIEYLSIDLIRDVFERAFSRWSAVIPLNFTEADDYWSADVRIGFYRGNHGDGEPFDGVLGVLAHAFSPENGRLHLDEAETWAVDFETEKSKVAVDLESVATHEVGHVLGLAHSSIKEAVMYPSLSPRTKKLELRMDDIEGVQALYGSNPDFKKDSWPASDTSDCSPVDQIGSLWWKILMVVIWFRLWL